MRAINHIVIHATATKASQDVSATDINRWHKHNGWSGIGYHYVVKLNGSIENGRPEGIRGAHVKGHNHDSIGVVYVGGLDENAKPDDTRTTAQKIALIKLLTRLKKKYPKAIISGHRDFSKDLNGNGVIEPSEFMKACPCFDAKTEYHDL
ncbi:N-acetylmuramoyl-L-alanine amidase [Pseudotamlana carrageenivorans]|uniref:N-acetylmuramoyl-L-alanine amidase n=1 Tax=Pseudotamlana carrageenivorans TaxID=2069432 RepID=A0A2I7SKV1_9FLAO|nr:N-acetylmuramoyl-L-alanine amidase [Tamlana carrageenivorans]AUS06477.1 N-acetylmuramoyl-L-alanine amidase [Tamlana carrageenivorans]